MWQEALIIVLILVIAYLCYMYQPWKTTVMAGEKGAPYKLLNSNPGSVTDAAKGVLIVNKEPTYFPHGYEIKIAEVK